MALLGCPFCRTMFEKGEAPVCPECGVKLVPFEKLPPSYESTLEDPPPLEALPELERLPWSYAARGRALLLALSLLGLLAFFLPWVELTFPEHELRSGFDLARGRAGWLWGGAVAWFVMLPLVWTRRSIAAMRGVRPVTALFASMSLGEVAMLLLLRPTAPSRLPFAFEWSYGLFLTGALSLLATVVAFRFGGSLPPLPSTAAATPESSKDRILH